MVHTLLFLFPAEQPEGKEANWLAQSCPARIRTEVFWLLVQDLSNTPSSESREGPTGQCPQRYSPCSSACLQPHTGGPCTSKGDRTPSGNYGHQETMDEELEALCFHTGFEPVFASLTLKSLFLSCLPHRVVVSSGEVRDMKVLRRYH